MIKLTPNPTFRATLALTVPGNAEGAKVEFEFCHKGLSALDAWIKKPALMAREGVTLSSTQYLDEVIASWSGPVDEHGADVPYSPEALQKLLDAYSPAAQEIYDGYRKQLETSRVKN
jgi:hypothetical protein